MIRNEARLKANPRTGPAVLGVNRIDPAERAEITMQAAAFRQSCGAYDTPADCEPPCEA
jgi:deoxyribodipyrimidine photolyase-related protein